MLLADSNRSNRIFNSLSGLIVDEAHQMGQIAIRHRRNCFFLYELEIYHGPSWF